MAPGKPPTYNKAASLAAAAKKKEKAKENPFDKFANARKKHEVLNRRVKGEDRNVGRAREKQIDERKKKLLQDMAVSSKSNAFVDRRFGESDPTLSLEEKMFMRFQKEKVKKARNRSIFNLDSSDGELLTHKGTVLKEDTIGINEWDEESDDDDNLGRDVVHNLHFGGGMVPSEASAQHRKSRMDSLQEIVMKSKLHKLEKKEAKDAQELDREKLDVAYDDLVKESMLSFKPKRRDRSEDVPVGEDEFADYDIALRTMVYEAKVKPSDRTKSAEELAAEAKKRLEELEAARVKRMHKADGDAREAERALRGGNKKRQLTDDDIGDDYEPYEGYKNKKDYLLHHDFGAQEQRLLEEEEEGEDEDDDEGEEDDEDGEEGDEEGEEEGEEGEDDEGKGDDEDEDEEEGEGAEEAGTGSAMRGMSLYHKWVQKRRARISRELSTSSVNPAMPHNIESPVSLLAFDELIEQYVSSDEDMTALIDRILVWNSVNLPGKEGAANRGRMHNFLDILIKHFIRIGDSLSDPKNTVADILSLLNHITLSIYTLCQDLGESCVALWGKLLKQMEVQLQKKLRDYVPSTSDCSWPSLGRLLLLRVIGHVFSVTDYEHTIVTSTMLFMCQCLTQCPVKTGPDVSSGLFLCCLLLEWTAETQKHVPEVLTFVRSLLNAQSVLPTKIQGTMDTERLANIRNASATASQSNETKLSFRAFRQDDTASIEGDYASAIITALQSLSALLVKRYTGNVAGVEILGPVLEELRAFRPQDAPVLPKALQVKHIELLESYIQVATESSQSRRSLHWRPTLKTSIEAKAPRFEVNYTMKKDKDADRDKAKLKQLGRQLKRETKSTIREIRRDADFIDQEQFRVSSEKKNALRDERAKNFAWMESEQATLNQQVRMGKGLMKGGGSGVTKKARIR